VKAALGPAAETILDAAGEVPDDVEAAADLAARPELRLWLRLSACNTLIDGRLRARLRSAFDTTPPRFELMALLDKAPDGLTMGELSKRLMVTNGNVTGIVERLVRDGLATRHAAPNDRRTHFVRLTPAGRDAYRTMARAHQDWLGELTAGMEREEVVSLLGLLDRLKRSVRATAPAAR
jgi:DNA-binding MarR family transcriptional regulator